MIIALGQARAAPGRRLELLEACAVVAQASLRDSGCLEYGFHADIADPDLVTSIEIWETQAALDAHMDHPHTKQFLASVTVLLHDAPKMQLFQAAPVT
jgi:quinol monooxygenase YgiN